MPTTGIGRAGAWRPQYQYEYKYNKTNNALYRLDKLEGHDSTRYDLLPSSRAALLKVLDHNNSYYYTEYQNHHRLMLEWEINAATGRNKMNIEYGYIRLPSASSARISITHE